MKGKILGGILLITGTTVGAGMLALPVLTGLGGFYPSVALFVICWLFTVYSAFLILEVNLWFDEEVNLISMAKHAFGRYGAAFTWLVYLLLLYSLTAAYIAGGGPLLAKGIEAILPYKLPSWSYPFPFLFLFGVFVYSGTRSVDLVNRFFMLGLVCSYALLLVWIAPHVQPQLLQHTEIRYAWLAMPVIVASFGFQMIIPSLTSYLHRDVNVMRKVIWLGTGLPFVIYIIWEWATLGVIPLQGHDGLLKAFIEGKPATYSLASISKSNWIANSANFFAFFSVVTSFLGSALSLASFLVDGLNLRRNFLGKAQTVVYTFLPPLLFVMIYPRGFIIALEYAGVFFAILLQILPALMVWKGRYYRRQSSTYRAPGGKFMLLLLLAYSIIVVGIEFLESKSLNKIAQEHVAKEELPCQVVS